VTATPELSIAFNLGFELFVSIDSGKVADDLEAVVKKSASFFTKALQKVKAERIYSSNEEVDDINTEDLRFCLCEYFLGELIQKMSLPAANDRLEALRYAKARYRSFIETILHYNLLDKDDIPLVEPFLAYWKGVEEDGTEENENDTLHPPRAEFERTMLINQTKRLSALQKTMKPSVWTHQGQISSELTDAVHEFARALWLNRIAYAAISAGKEYRMIERELPLLQMSAAGVAPPERPPPKPGAKPEMLTLLNREAALNTVFRAPFLAPTMSLEEYGEQLMAEEAAKQQEKSLAQSQAVVNEYDEDRAADEREELERQKQSAMDDWKDTITKGEGNRGGNLG